MPMRTQSAIDEQQHAAGAEAHKAAKQLPNNAANAQAIENAAEVVPQQVHDDAMTD